MGDSSQIAARGRKRAAHFLWVGELIDSPPNEALISALLELGFEVDVYAPTVPVNSQYGSRVRTFALPGAYGARALLRSVASWSWNRYDAFSATAEDPLVYAHVLAKLWRKPFIAIVDEIKTGSYWGDRSTRWKKACARAIRVADICVVNDESRIKLIEEYADRSTSTMVYPGGFRQPPPPRTRGEERARWGAQDDQMVIGLSGGVNLTSGLDWALEAIASSPTTFGLVQAVNLDPLVEYLLRNHLAWDRLFFEPARLGWRDAWASAAACDIGVAIYRNTAPQFQNMGISSNRLCMFLCMGVPVIASRQPSFRFLEEYECGVLVDSADEFAAAVKRISSRLPTMRENAFRCAREYISTPTRYDSLKRQLTLALS
jgi:glycosyltransferase involved in cell wall biosynthesis